VNRIILAHIETPDRSLKPIFPKQLPFDNTTTTFQHLTPCSMLETNQMDDFREGDKGTLLLFGPQLTTWDAVRLTSLRKAISVEPDLQFFSSIVKSLCHVWRDEISNSCPGLVRGLIDAESTLHRLHALLETEDDGIALGPDSPTPNILLVPLTVVAQIVEFVRLQRRGRVQGFCVGFLAASVVAASQSQSDFQQRTDAAIRLAVCIGAAVDLDEKQRSAGDTELDNLSSTWSIRWTSTTQKERLDDLLASFPGVRVFLVNLFRQVADSKHRSTYLASPMWTE
jgi:hypothetical protein